MQQRFMLTQTSMVFHHAVHNYEGCYLLLFVVIIVVIVANSANTHVHAGRKYMHKECEDVLVMKIWFQ